MSDEVPISDEDKAFFFLQEAADEAICQLEEVGWGLPGEDKEWEPGPDGFGLFKVGNEIFDVQMKVERRIALEKPNPT